MGINIDVVRLVLTVVGLVGTSVCGVVGFFLRRCLNQIDESIKELQHDAREERERVDLEILRLRNRSHELANEVNAINLRVTVSEATKPK